MLPEIVALPVALRMILPAVPVLNEIADSCPPDVASKVLGLILIAPPVPLAVVWASTIAPSEILNVFVFTVILPPTPEELVLVNMPLDTPSKNFGGELNLGGMLF